MLCVMPSVQERGDPGCLPSPANTVLEPQRASQHAGAKGQTRSSRIPCNPWEQSWCPRYVVCQGRALQNGALRGSCSSTLVPSSWCPVRCHGASKHLLQPGFTQQGAPSSLSRHSLWIQQAGERRLVPSIWQGASLWPVPVCAPLTVQAKAGSESPAGSPAAGAAGSKAYVLGTVEAEMRRKMVPREGWLLPPGLHPSQVTVPNAKLFEHYSKGLADSNGAAERSLLSSSGSLCFDTGFCVTRLGLFFCRGKAAVSAESSAKDQALQ
ncbi:hypothetical protein KIL84_020851 [Mauremys mutica]|uniref:Uncharacterized protein n=1 Tax=Mauremys mutica TaxID=74926 RepID=A0A9D3XAW0_9SAUR|nr:hypothetical protein KIL84_020851 [Mauremys mutica]